MNGTVVSFFEKQKKAGGAYYNVVMQVDGNQSQFLCTDAATMEKVSGSVGQVIDFYTFKSKDGTATFMSLPKSGGTATTTSYSKKADPSRNESFACAYAKDIVVACIGNGFVKEVSQIEQMLGVYIAYFLEKLNQKS